MKKSFILLFFAIPTVCSIGLLFNESQDTEKPNAETHYQTMVPHVLTLTSEKVSNQEVQPQYPNLIVKNEAVPKAIPVKTANTTSQYDMSWVNIYGKSTPEMLAQSWAAWRITQGTDNYAVKALGEAIKEFPSDARAYVLAEILYKINNEKDYTDFIKSNADLFETAYEEVSKGQEDLSEQSALVLTALGRCRVKWYFQDRKT